ncbi:MAG: TlpA family protein disulfide reductase [Acidobacteria bacterium]|nr:TlpA family protein disulfide reductase [Acidobacteriota bacterium]
MARVALILITGTLFVYPQTQPTNGTRFFGKLQAELKPDLVHVYQRVLDAKSTSQIRFDPAIDKKALVSSGALSDPRVESGRSDMLLVEPPSGEPFVAIDLNGNGVIEVAERFTLKKDSNGFVSIIRLPVANPFFKTYPIFIHYVHGFKHPDLKPMNRLIYQSVMALAYGDVEIGARRVLFQYPFEPRSPAISTIEGLFGIDSDGDGKIRDEQFSPESSYAAKSEIVFRLGDQFVSTEKIDLARNEIVVRSRGREEYLRHDVEIAKELPDFSFVDFEAKKRSLYEFKGKYLLLDFWGVWCVDCRAETPYHVEAYRRFRTRGLEILSLNTDENIETAKGYIAKNKMPWTQATNDSIRTLAEVTYRIQEYPSTILIGPDAKVIVFDQKLLRADELLKTLERTLPK